jgi:hypothetical protein
LRPIPEYPRLSVRSIADSSSVGSRLADVLAIFVAAIPGATPMPVFALLEELPVVAELLLDLVATGGLTCTGAGTGAGLLDPPKKVLYANTTKTSSSTPKMELTMTVFLSCAGAALMASLLSR